MNEDPPDLEPIDLEPTELEPTELEPIDLTAWPSGWYADPWTAGQSRFWDGAAWTGETYRPGAVAAPAVSAVPGPAFRTMYPRSRRSRGGAPAIVAGLVALALLSGAVGYAIQASTESNDSANRAQGPTTTAPGPTTPAPDAADRRALSGLVVQQADVGATSAVVLIPNGNRTTQPTLDLCNGTFETEKLRVARLQVAEVDTNGRVLLSTEAVTYRNAAATTAAFAELRRVRAECPNEPVTSPVGEQTAETRFNARPDQSWKRTPSDERQAYSFTTTAAGNTSASIAVYLRRGRVLLGVYFPKPAGAQPGVEGKTSVEDIVGLFEARMAALPANVVDGSARE